MKESIPVRPLPAMVEINGSKNVGALVGMPVGGKVGMKDGTPCKGVCTIRTM